MWIAVCSNPYCRWDHAAYGKISALAYADSHRLERYRDGTHRVHIVSVPEDPLPVGATGQFPRFEHTPSSRN